MSLGGGYSKSSSEQNIDPVQMSYLTPMWAAGQNLMASQLPAAGQAGQDLYNQYAPIGDAGVGAFGQAAQGQLAGQQALAQNMGQANPWLNQSIDAVGADIGRNLAQNILPELRSGGIAAGQAGSSRHGIAEGMAMQAAQDSFADAATGMRSADIMRQQQAAMGLTQSQMLGAQGAVQAAPSMAQFGMMPFQSAFLPLQMQAGLLGNPTVLADSSSYGINGSIGI